LFRESSINSSAPVCCGAFGKYGVSIGWLTPVTLQAMMNEMGLRRKQ
jgi:hypothetical protein